VKKKSLWFRVHCRRRVGCTYYIECIKLHSLKGLSIGVSGFKILIIAGFGDSRVQGLEFRV
jgi:hypothetical protein